MYKTLALLTVTALFTSQAYAVEGTYEKFGQQTGEAVQNAADYTDITYQLTKDPLLSPFNIKVDFKDDTAYLSGVVETDMQFDRAVTIASSADGVNNVNTDQLVIKTSQAPLTDLLTTGKIKGYLIKSKFTEGADMANWPFQVETKDGTVYLTGETDSLERADTIISKIKGMDGVKDVKYDLKITSTNEPYTNK